MEDMLTMIGFGEAASTFAPHLAVGGIRSYDRQVDDPARRSAKIAEIERAGGIPAGSAADALIDADAVFSLVTADQALVAATDAVGLAAGALWFDMNSVAPGTKRAAATAIETRGGRYVDVAIMAPVRPASTTVPLLVAGPHAEDGAARLVALGFSNVTIVAGDIGAASCIKMIRSVMIKGVEALSAECALAADAAGVTSEVIASLDASWPGADWGRRLDYNIDRMIVHGSRRAAEMREVVSTLDALGTGSAMSRNAGDRHRAIGAFGPVAPEGLHAKLRMLAA